MNEIPRIKQILEGAILAAGKPLSIDGIIQLFGEHEQPSRQDVKDILTEIAADFEGRGFELKQVASGYRFQVRTDLSDWVGRLWDEKPPKYTRALLETLALIAYKQPITRGDIEEIRGVTVSTNIIRSLLEREWIRIVGHRDVPGRPAIYATTREFLDYFNLQNLDELPPLSEIKDLDKMNAELDLGAGELIEPRSLALEISDDQQVTVDAAATLEEVTKQVNEIQQNIDDFVKKPEVEEQAEQSESQQDTLESGNEITQHDSADSPNSPDSE
ncbi:MAG: SMC-Scp complex subunit ScpB [Pseudomonadales bacterium]|nr:SMC-Scp complex subunit ScpB [Pseudomonadales bacterium]